MFAASVEASASRRETHLANRNGPQSGSRIKPVVRCARKAILMNEPAFRVDSRPRNARARTPAINTRSLAALKMSSRPAVPAPPKPEVETRHLVFSHPIVVRAAAAFRRDPGDDLVGIGDVARLAVYAVCRVQADALAEGLRYVVDQFIDISGAEVLARTAVFLRAAGVADVGVGDDQVRRLVFLVLGAGVVEVGELVEG